MNRPAHRAAPAARLPLATTVPRLNRVWVAMGLFWSAFTSQAIVFHATGDPGYNTTPPTGQLTNSGWRYQGLWGAFLGTAVAPRYFLTAKHVGGSVGDEFRLNGVSFLTTAQYPSTNCDLTLWRVCGIFPVFAPLYTNANEAGKSLVVFGRGTQRGAPVVTTNLLGSKTNGWLWADYDGVTRWGENAVTDIADGGAVSGRADVGDLLKAEFNANGLANECHLSWGDSGGAVFLQEGPTWKLAGINYSVDGPYNHTSSEAGKFEAALVDQGGLYQYDGTNWVGTPDLPQDQAGAFYATRLSSHLDWVNTVLSLPLPEEERLVLQSADSVRGPYRDDPTATLNEATRTILLPQPARPQFYRLRSCRALTIDSVHAPDGILILSYR